MSEATPTAARSGRSWRDISQDVKPRAMSRKGRRRQYSAWFRAGGFTVLAGTLAFGVFSLAHEWMTDRAAFAESVDSAPVRELSVITNGTLPKKWVEQTLALPKGATLLALDLPALRDKLLAHGQVRLAVVSRKFPDMLVVTLQERTPVARIQAQTGLGQPKQLFVAKDGVVYEGTNYDSALVNTLPWLDGIRLQRQKNGYTPIDGMAEVTNLLSTAQVEAPHLYRSWMIVSLARLADRDEITVKSQDVPEIIFSRKVDFYKQVAQLDSILDLSRQLPETSLRTINLALGGQIPVRFERSPDELNRLDYSPAFTIQPLQRKTSREL